DGTGRFTQTAAFPTRAGVLAPADFDRDGAQDIAVLGPRSQVSVLLGDGSGGFTLSPREFGTPPWGDTRAADFDGDGRTDDIVWRHQVSGQNVVWFMDDATLISGAFTNPS